MSDVDVINRVFPDRSAGRWCPSCEQCGSHHSDRHDEFLTHARAHLCTCGMAEQERTGHSPEHEDWCEVSDD